MCGNGIWIDMSQRAPTAWSAAAAGATVRPSAGRRFASTAGPTAKGAAGGREATGRTRLKSEGRPVVVPEGRDYAAASMRKSGRIVERVTQHYEL